MNPIQISRRTRANRVERESRSLVIAFHSFRSPHSTPGQQPRGAVLEINLQKYSLIQDQEILRDSTSRMN